MLFVDIVNPPLYFTFQTDLTVNEVYDSYIKQKYDLKPTTRTTYVYA